MEGHWLQPIPARFGESSAGWPRHACFSRLPLSPRFTWIQRNWATPRAAYGLLGFYMGNSILVLMLVRRRKASTAAFRLLVHAADIIWPAFISVFAEGPRSPFFLFFFFVLTAAAYRWGLWETLSTAAAEVVLLWVESFLLLHVWAARAGGLPWHVLSGLQINVSEFEPKRLFMLSVYLLVMGLLLGYLAEQQKHLRAEKAVVTRLLSKVRVDAGLTGTLQQISREIVSMYGADRLLVASQEIHSHRTFLGELRNGDEASDFVWLDSSPRDAKIYLEDFPGEAFYATQRGRPLVRGRGGSRRQSVAVALHRRAGPSSSSANPSALWLLFLLSSAANGAAACWCSIRRGTATRRSNCAFCSICSGKLGRRFTTFICCTG